MLFRTLLREQGAQRDRTYSENEMTRMYVTDFSSFTSHSVACAYSGVPNKRGGGENNRGGWKWFNITVIGGVGIIGGSWRNRK